MTRGVILFNQVLLTARPESYCFKKQAGFDICIACKFRVSSNCSNQQMNFHNRLGIQFHSAFLKTTNYVELFCLSSCVCHLFRDDNRMYVTTCRCWSLEKSNFFLTWLLLGRRRLRFNFDCLWKDRRVIHSMTTSGATRENEWQRMSTNDN